MQIYIYININGKVSYEYKSKIWNKYEISNIDVTSFEYLAVGKSDTFRLHYYQSCNYYTIVITIDTIVIIGCSK